MDLIDREQALNVLDAEAWSFTEYLQKEIGNVFDVHLACFVDDVRERIKDMPTVQAVPIEEVLKIIEFEEKWLSQTRMSIRDIDIAFNAMKSKIKQIEGSDKE